MDDYRRLQKHLNTLPIGYPRTFTGVEIKLLKRFFGPLHCRVALHMSFSPDRADDIFARFDEDLRREISSVGRLEAVLGEMVARGGVMFRRPERTYALMAFIVGMYETQLREVGGEFLDQAVSFGYQGFGLEYLTTSEPQTRVIPVNSSVRAEQRVATYDELERLIREAEGRIAVIPCICRIGADSRGRPCERTDEREICLALRDYADEALARGEGRALSVDEALELARKNEEAGLVLQCTNDKNPQFICACCDCCCGLLGMIKASPAPAEHIGSSFRVEVDGDKCRSCTACVQRCPMEALTMGDNLVVADYARCVGCGVCVSSCRFDALALAEKERLTEPAEDMAAYYERLARDKSDGRRKARMVFRVLKKLLA